MSETTNVVSPEVRGRALRRILDDQGQHGPRWQAVVPIAAKIGHAPQTDWVWKAAASIRKTLGSRLR